MLGSEIEKPQRNLPRALITGTLCMMAVYLLTNLTYFYILSGPEVGGSERVAADMMRKVLGQPGAAMVSVAAMISIFAALNGSILSGSRVPYAMARDGLFFKSASKVHPQFSHAWRGNRAVGRLVLTGFAERSIQAALYVGDLSSWILYGMTAASVIVLRKKRPDLERPYRVLGYPVVPALFVLVAVALLYSTLRSSPRESGIGLVLIAAGLPFYFHWKRRRGTLGM